MKKASWKMSFIFIFFTFVLLVATFAEGNESNNEETDLYYVNVRIIKIFPHRKGYYVVYRRAGLKTGKVFIPAEWFTASDGRAKLVRIGTRVSPYLSFFVRNGEFEYVKISAPRDLNHSAWGMLQTPRAYDEYFEGVESLELKF